MDAFIGPFKQRVFDRHGCMIPVLNPYIFRGKHDKESTYTRDPSFTFNEKDMFGLILCTKDNSISPSLNRKCLKIHLDLGETCLKIFILRFKQMGPSMAYV